MATTQKNSSVPTQPTSRSIATIDAISEQMAGQVHAWTDRWQSGQTKVADRLATLCTSLQSWHREIAARETALAERESLLAFEREEAATAERDDFIAQIASLEAALDEALRLGESIEASRQQENEAYASTIESLKQSIADSQAESSTLAGELSDAEARIARWKEREESRLELESELEAVRLRGAELAETVERYEQQMEEDRAHWADELRSVRALLEQSSFDGTHTNESGRRTAAEATSQASAAPVRAAEAAVVGSVRAQFEKLRAAKAKDR